MKEPTENQPCVIKWILRGNKNYQACVPDGKRRKQKNNEKWKTEERDKNAQTKRN